MTVEPKVGEFLAALDRTQYLPADQLRAYQRRLLDRLLRHARAETEFYAHRLAPLFRADDTIDWERWAEIPILTRLEAQENEDALTAGNLPASVGRAIPTTTSGSTARPFRHFNTDIQNIASGCANERFFLWHALNPAALAASIIDVDDPEKAKWPEGHSSLGWRLGHPESPSITLRVATPVHLQVEWLRRKRPALLTGFPGNIREIGRTATAEGAPLRFDAVLTIGETVTPATAAEMEDHFGVAPLDRYGSTEIGHIAATCPHSRGHHVSAELVLIEIVDEHGDPVPAGTAGRIVATSFYNYATPMIRYDMGDHGALSTEPCGCGRTLPVLERILGRTRNMFRFADGSSVWPVLPPELLVPLLPHRRFQVVQTAPDLIEIRFVPAEPDARYDLAAITALARQQLHPSISVKLVATDDIAPAASGKFEDYVSLVES
jgi:phenylacetate-CoA ligase